MNRTERRERNRIRGLMGVRITKLVDRLVKPGCYGLDPQKQKQVRADLQTLIAKASDHGLTKRDIEALTRRAPKE